VTLLRGELPHADLRTVYFQKSVAGDPAPLASRAEAVLIGVAVPQRAAYEYVNVRTRLRE
jgi:hypothetical protein